MYMYIFSYIDKCRQNSCRFKTLDKLGTCPTFFKITTVGSFFQIDPKLCENKAHFEENLRFDFFVPINF